MSLDVPDSPGSETICQSYFELQFRSKDSQRSFTTPGHFVGTQMTGNKTRTNSAHRGQSCKYPAIYILQCCNLIFHVLHFHVIRMKNNFVKNLFSHDQPKMQTCRLRADTLSLWSTNPQNSPGKETTIRKSYKFNIKGSSQVKRTCFDDPQLSHESVYDKFWAGVASSPDLMLLSQSQWTRSD